MARIRTIKPEFAKDEAVGRVSRDARLMWVEMWPIADDEGRLRGHPLYLKSELFPYDDDIHAARIEELLVELEQAKGGRGFIRRYQADGQAYIEVRRFLDHQRISKPTPSRLPAPPTEDSATPPEPFREDSATSPEESRWDLDLEGKGSGSGSGEEEEGAVAPLALLPPEESFESQAEAIYNATAKRLGLPTVRDIKGKRRKHLLARRKDLLPDLAAWETLLAALEEQPFLRGENDRGWTADFDWLVENEDNPGKVLERKYVQRNGHPLTARDRGNLETLQRFAAKGEQP